MIFASVARAFGPATANCAHCSVTETILHVEVGPQRLVAELDGAHDLARHWPWWWS
jgi:hypothetical protein